MERAKGERTMRAIQATAGRWATFCLWIFFLAGLSGCIHPVSKNVMETVNQDLAFSMVIQNPKAYMSSIVLWGGVIENAGHGPEGTKLIVIQTPLDAHGYPQTNTSEGEFIAHTPKSLDLQVFQSGTKVTIAGEIDGVDEKEHGPMEYPRPLVRVIEIHAWIERLLGIFQLTKGWKIDQSGPFPSPFEEPPEKRNDVP
jgi:starvation-inducible outer membrane lipoprotein